MDLDQRHHVELWAFAFLTFVVGDSLTTVLGLKRGAVESNPVGRGFSPALGDRQTEQ